MYVHQPIENSEKFVRKRLHGNLDDLSLEMHHLHILGHRYPVGNFVTPGRKHPAEAYGRHCCENWKILGLRTAGGLGGFDSSGLPEDPGKWMVVEK